MKKTNSKLHLSVNNFLEAAQVFTHEFCCHNFDQSENRLVLERDQSVTKLKANPLKIIFDSFYHRQLKTRNFKIFTEATLLVASKLIKFPSLIYRVSPLPPPLSVLTGRRTLTS